MSFETTWHEDKSLEEAGLDLRGMVEAFCVERNLKAPTRATINTLDGSPLTTITANTPYQIDLTFV